MSAPLRSRRGFLGATVLFVVVGCAPSSPDGGSGGGQTFSATVGSGSSGGASSEPKSDPAAPLALVEIFTSEGCNSCPPVEERFATLEQTYTGQRAFFLAWHVDYWDYLGWADPYGSEDFANRQRNYASAFEQDSIFTPDLRVNTINQQPPTVASVSAAIDAALDVAVPVAVTLWRERTMPDPLPVAFRVEGAPPDSVLHFALVESGMLSEPTTGENAGATLNHENVVRIHYAFEPVERGVLSLHVPDGVNLDEAKVVAWVQSRDLLTVHGAGMLPVATAD